MDNSTGPQQGNTLPRLHHGPDGWSGSGPHFRIVGNVIKIKESDANITHVPNEEQRRRVYDEEGNFSEHVQQTTDDRLYQLWMRKIGPYLGDWVLGKGHRVSPPWKLLKLPEGYTLWLHKTGSINNPANPRTDAYLHGAPHLGIITNRSQPLSPTVFRSPMEFVEHAIWLMRGRAGRCQCKYCVPGQNQTEINERLDHGEPHPDDDGDNDAVIVVDNNDDDKGTGPSPSSSSARPKGTGRGTRGRRAKRDRSPPIMAKDYRTGNAGASATGDAGGSGTA